MLEKTFEKCHVDVTLLIGAQGCQSEAGTLMEQQDSGAKVVVVH